MSYFAPALLERHEPGATNPRTNAVFDWFLHIRFPSGEQTEVHDHGVIGDKPANVDAPHPLISLSLQDGRSYDLLLATGIDRVDHGVRLPEGWSLRMDLSNADTARLACQIVELQWHAPNLPYLDAYPELSQVHGVLVESDIGRFVLDVDSDQLKELHVGDYLWWTGYLRFGLLAALNM